MKYLVNKYTKTIELLPSVFTAKELLELVEQFKDYSFLVSPQKSEKQGMVVGANYVSIVGDIEYN